MMIRRLDEPTSRIFDAPENPPNWIEAVDIDNQEYAFCDDDGQRYAGVITRRGRRSWPEAFELQPIGVPNISNAIKLVDSAVVIEPNDRFPDLASLRAYLVGRQTA